MIGYGIEANMASTALVKVAREQFKMVLSGIVSAAQAIHHDSKDRADTLIEVVLETFREEIEAQFTTLDKEPKP